MMNRLGVLLATSFSAFMITLVTMAATYSADEEPSLGWRLLLAVQFLCMMISALTILFLFTRDFVRVMRFEMSRVRLMKEVQRRG